jgi:hypothetical protein
MSEIITTTRCVKLSEIVTTCGTQIRASINHEAVAEYAEQMLDGVKFPPVVLFHDGSEYILADGFHRVMAASRNGFKDILAEVHKGTRSDALRYALSANAKHGLRRTTNDKRRSIELALSEWPNYSDRQIADICGVSNMMVAAFKRIQVKDSFTSPEKVEGKDGKTYPARHGRPNKTRKRPIRQAQAANPPEQSAPTSPETFSDSSPDPSEAPSEITSHVEPNVTAYYSKLESVMMDAISNATDRQLTSMAVYAALLPRLIKDELNRRRK